MTERVGCLEELRQLTQQLCGLVSWGSRAGSGTGSIFTLQFGRPLAENPAWGEFSIMVYSAWRITADTTRLGCTWREDARTVLRPNLLYLQEKRVTAASVSDWGDLHLTFATGWHLHVFADLPTPISGADDCWFISAGRHHYASWTTNSEVHIQSIE